jgi:hypothetical protein
MIARIVRTWRQCGDVAALAEWIAPIEQAMSAAPASGSGNSGPHWRAPAGRAVRRQAQGPLLLGRPSATVCWWVPNTTVQHKRGKPSRMAIIDGQWVWPSFNPTYWNYLGWPARRASGAWRAAGDLAGLAEWIRPIEEALSGDPAPGRRAPGRPRRRRGGSASSPVPSKPLRPDGTGPPTCAGARSARLPSHDRELAERFGLTL